MKPGLFREYAGAIATVMWLLDLMLPVITFYVSFEIYLRAEFGNIPLRYNLALLPVILAAAIVFPRLSLGRGWRGQSLLSEAKAVTFSLVAVFGILAVFAAATKTTAEFSRVWFALWFGMTWVLMVGYRGILRVILRWARSQGFNQRSVVIAGTGSLLDSVIDNITNTPWTGFQIAGVFRDDNRPKGAKPLGAQSGDYRDLIAFLSQENVDQIWLVMPLRDEEKLARLLHDLRHTTADIRYIPDIFGFRLLNHSVSTIAGLPVLNLSASPMDGANRFVKAIEDKVLAVLILLLISPVMLLIALAVRVTSRGPVFYKQTRIGWNNKPIEILKFRTMPVNVESVSGPVWAKKGEARTTIIGAFLRRTSLDELPQFINVLRGEMSIVGPRPERPMFVEQFKEEVPDYMKKHLVKAGITGWAQVNGWRGNTDLHKRIEHDIYYIENWSLAFDLKIIFLTLTRGFVHKNAY